MKKHSITIILLVLQFLNATGQISYLTRIKITKDDSTLLVTNTDTTYIFSAFVLTHNLGGITTLTVTTKNYNSQTASWTISKDTSYVWNNVNSTQNSNQAYSICKPNDNLVKICLGRLYANTRQKFIFYVNGSNGVLTKEFDF